ncbi:MAG: ABC transporter ATP-binding protein [Acidimicrobiia bacterium]
MRMPPHMALGHDRSAVAGKQFDRRIARRAWAFAKPYRKMIYGFLATIVLSALIALAPPFIFGKGIIDNAIPNADRRLAVILAVIAVVVNLLDGFLSIAQRWWSAHIGEGLIYELRSSLFDKVQRQPVAFFTRTQTGALISRLNNDVIGAQNAVTGTLGSVVSNTVVLVTTLGAMIFLEWRLTLISLLVLPLFVIPAKRVGIKLQEISRESMNLNARMNTQMTERFNVSGAMLVKLFGAHDTEARDFSKRAARVRDIGIRNAMYGRLFFVGLGLAAVMGTAAVYGVGAHMVISGDIEDGVLVTMALLVTRIYAPLTALTNTRVDLMTALVSFERVFEVLDAPNPIEDRPGAVELVAPRGEVQFDHVSFRYPAANEVSLMSLESPGSNALLDSQAGVEVLKDIDLTIAPGQMVAVVGPSGAGKSTLTSLLPRLYDVTSGAVRIDGHDVRDLTQESLRKAIGVVAQDPHMFHETVAQNLRYAKPEATQEDLERACRAAQIHDVVDALPEKYDTLVGERGYRLSGGEKQRLAIARMLLKDPAVVILDEATSHLDSENESLVQDALEVALRGRTSLVIAHRLSTIIDADLIVVIDDGRIVERGTHNELMASGGLYSELYLTLTGDRPAE